MVRINNMKIGLQNFQGIGAYTEIPIAPITLFYGPNSAGKSTVADAFQFLYGTLSGENKNWKVDLEKHARRNRVDRPLNEGFIGDPNDVVFTVEGSTNREAAFLDKFEALESYADSIGWNETHKGIDQIFVDGKKFEYQINFAQVEGTYEWQLRESLLTIDEQPLFRIQESYIVAFNIRHPAYQQLKKLDDLIRWWFFLDDDNKVLGNEIIVDESVCWRTIDSIDIDDPFSFSLIDCDCDELYGTDIEVKVQHRILRGYLSFFIVMPAKWASSSYAIYEVPPLRPLPENLAAFEVKKLKDFNSLKGFSVVTEAAAEAYEAANEALAAAMEASIWKVFNLNGCWEVLADEVRKIKLGKKPEVTEKFAITFINDVLTSRDFLDTGYAIDGEVKFKFLLGMDELANLVQLDSPSRQEKLLHTPAVVHLYLVYQPENFRVEIVDVGVGISQVVPVLFGCWQAMSARNGVHIQQPELHLHPKLQAQLADVFIKCISEPTNSGTFLLESHSEHLLLRLLRRIRESHMATVNRGGSLNGLATVTNIQKVKGHELKADQVSVVYVSKDESGITKMKPLRLSDDGEFIDRWPNGFFTERDIELFGDEGPFA